MPLWAVLCAGLGLAGCSAGDYVGGVDSFSKAVGATHDAEQTLSTAAQQAQLNEWTQQALQADPTEISVDFAKCLPPAAKRPAGTCAVTWKGVPAPTTPDPSSMTSLVKYAALLAAVPADKTCATLHSDAQELAASIGDLAKDARATERASEAGPISVIASSAGCFFVQQAQLAILRTATASANPIVQKLVPVIEDKDNRLYRIVMQDNLNQLQQAALAYNRARSPADLARMVTLAGALNKAQANPPGPAIANIATLHQSLTDDLASPSVNLRRVEADAQALTAQASAVAAALRRLREANLPPVSTKPATGMAKKSAAS